MLRSSCNAVGPDSWPVLLPSFAPPPRRKSPGSGPRFCGGCLLLLVWALPVSLVGQSDASGPSLGKLQFRARPLERTPVPPRPGDVRAFLRKELRTLPAFELSRAPASPTFAFQSLPGPPAGPPGTVRGAKLPQFIARSSLFSNARMQNALNEIAEQGRRRTVAEGKSARTSFDPRVKLRGGVRLNLRLLTALLSDVPAQPAAVESPPAPRRDSDRPLQADPLRAAR